MLHSLSNPIFWQGFATAWAVFLPTCVVLLAVTGRTNDDVPRSGRRGGAR